MRICFFTTDCVLPTKGGIEKVVYNLSKTFQEKGLSVIIISTTDSNGLEYPFDFQYSLPLSSDILHKDNIAFVDDLIKNIRLTSSLTLRIKLKFSNYANYLRTNTPLS